MPRPTIIHDPNAGTFLQRGFDTLANLLALTIRPTGGVVISGCTTNSQPEVLSDSVTIARRMIGLPHAAENIGAVLLRNLVWAMHQSVGDGAATAALLAQAMLEHARRYIAAGVNAMILRCGMERAVQVAGDVLIQMALPIRGEQDLPQLIQTMTAEPDLSLVLAEIFDLLGPDAYVQIRDYKRPYFERAYQERERWKARLLSPTSPRMLPDPARVCSTVTSCCTTVPLMRSTMLGRCLSWAAARRCDVSH